MLLFYVLAFWPWGMWDLTSPTRDCTHTPCIRRWSLNHWTIRGTPALFLRSWLKISEKPSLKVYLLLSYLFFFFSIAFAQLGIIVFKLLTACKRTSTVCCVLESLKLYSELYESPLGILSMRVTWFNLYFKKSHWWSLHYCMLEPTVFQVYIDRCWKCMDWKYIVCALKRLQSS